MSTTTIRETLLRKVSVLPSADCPEVLDFIETLEANRKSAKEWDTEDEYNEEEYKEWLRLNPPIPIEDDPTITPEHLERLRQRFKDIDEGKTKVITFTPEELEDFWQEMEHSPEEAIAKAESRAYYRTPKQS